MQHRPSPFGKIVALTSARLGIHFNRVKIQTHLSIKQLRRLENALVVFPGGQQVSGVGRVFAVAETVLGGGLG
jgi:hypothetical protein